MEDENEKKVQDVENTDVNKKESEGKSFDDILKENKELQSEFDKRIAKSLDTAKKKWEKDFTEQKEKEKAEAERLAKLTAEEKIAEREKKVQARENALNKQLLINQTQKVLLDNALPICFAENIVTEDDKAEDITKKIEILKTAFNEELKKAVTKRLAGTTPAKSEEKEDNTQLSALRRAMGLKNKNE